MVKVDCGMANINGYICKIDEDYLGRFYNVLLPEAHPQFDRIDRLVLRLDTGQAVRSITPVISMGVAAASPVPPGLTRSGSIYELSLARIRVRANTLVILDADIIDERADTHLCGLINSILGLDPSVWQKQFDDFMEMMRTHAADDLAAYLATLQGKTELFQSVWDAWFTTIQLDPVRYITFNFDNATDFPGCTRRTTFPPGTMLTEWRVTANGQLVARQEFVFVTMTKTTILFAADGQTVLKHTPEETRFPAGAIETEVSA
jgi:hypothetical protein